MDDLIARLEELSGPRYPDDITGKKLMAQAAAALRAYAEREKDYWKALLAAYAALDNGADREDLKDDLRAILSKHKEGATPS
jgi:hypothetical protein